MQNVTETPYIQNVTETPYIQNVTETPYIQNVTETPYIQNVTETRYIQKSNNNNLQIRQAVFKIVRPSNGNGLKKLLCNFPYDTVTVYLVSNVNKYQKYTLQGVDLSRFFKVHSLV
jgi:hypothetical protein